MLNNFSFTTTNNIGNNWWQDWVQLLLSTIQMYLIAYLNESTMFNYDGLRLKNKKINNNNNKIYAFIGSPSQATPQSNKCWLAW